MQRFVCLEKRNNSHLCFFTSMFDYRILLIYLHVSYRSCCKNDCIGVLMDGWWDRYLIGEISSFQASFLYFSQPIFDVGVYFRVSVYSWDHVLEF